MNTIDFRDLPKVIFISGTGTDVGKSYATGWLAREINRSGESCITQKFIQTGNIGRSEDIELHRKIMGIEMTNEDRQFITAPVIFSYPASPDLAARIDNAQIDFTKIDKATEKLKEHYDHVLIEGAGGLMVPLKDCFLTIDYIKENDLPLILVISGELGSINHSLLSFEIIKNRGLDLIGVIYNPYFDKDKTISSDSKNYLKKWLEKNFRKCFWAEMPVLS